MIKKLVLNAAIILSLFGCASVGTDFSQEDVAKIHMGETTEQQLFETFGKPYTTTSDSDGNKTFTWNYAYATALSPGKGKLLLVKLNSSGTVD